MMRRLQKVCLMLLAAIVAFCIWFSIASNYDESAVAGVYVAQREHATSTLLLQSDGSFVQYLDGTNQHLKTTGRWHRIGEGGIVMSPQFMSLATEQRSASVETYGEVHKVLTLFPVLWIDGQPVYRRSYFHGRMK
jgi:hypothetical protein